MTDLVLANSIQLTGHALVMLWLVNRLAPLAGRGLGPIVVKAGLASIVMAAGLWIGEPFINRWLPSVGLISEVLRVGLLSVFGGGLYLLIIIALRVPELALLLNLGRKFLGQHDK